MKYSEDWEFTLAEECEQKSSRTEDVWNTKMRLNESKAPGCDGD
jgi:hypothetical protein